MNTLPEGVVDFISSSSRGYASLHHLPVVVPALRASLHNRLPYKINYSFARHFHFRNLSNYELKCSQTSGISKKGTDSAGLRTFSWKIGGFPFSPKGLSNTTHHILFPLTIYFMNYLTMKFIGSMPKPCGANYPILFTRD